MNDAQLETLDHVQQFLEGTEAISFQIEGNDARYRWLQHTLVKIRYLKLSKTSQDFCFCFGCPRLSLSFGRPG